MSINRTLVVGDTIEKSALRFPRKIAIISGNSRLTYKDLDRQSNRFVNAMLGLGVKFGDKIAVLSRNCPEFVVIHYGLAKIGAVMVPLNFRYTGRELTFVTNDSETNTLIFQQEYIGLVESCRQELTNIQNYVCIGEDYGGRWVNDYYQMIDNHPDTSPNIMVKEEDEFNLLYTAGTTGFPKGAIITHKASIATNLSVIIDFYFEEDDIILISGPLFHSGQLNLSLHPMITMGGTAVLLSKFDPDEVLYTIEKERVTKVGLVPTMLYNLLQSPELTRFDLSSLKKLNYGASPIPRNVLEMALEYFKNIKITQSYGSTEDGLLTVLKPYEQLRKFGCTGRPLLFVDVRVVDQEGCEVLPGETGEIVTRGPHVMKGYFKRPRETEEAFRDGWFHTGDMAMIDDEGFITIMDRKLDLIISGGENIYPKEVEDVLYTHPAVSEAAVFGIPDEKWVEAVCAAIVLKPGMRVSEAEIIDYCTKSLASYKKPKVITFVNSLRKNEVGKVMKRQLKDPYWKEVGRKI
jgi:acyl-CoA synthetase (AMP-forming)/AMP-acid ligase II